MTQIANLPLVENLNNTLIVPVVDASDGNKTKRLTISALSTLSKGAQGAQGVQGTFGPQGPANGPQGITGTQGITGIQGTRGVQGIQGIHGARGIQGTQGVQGIQGVRGLQGTQGIQGTQGLQGISGTNAGQGVTGGQGATGSQGVQGPLTSFNTGTLVTSAVNAAISTTVAYNNSSALIATTQFVGKSVPRGVIWLWNSTAASIPTGFQLCDGTNGTPDLRSKFIIGASASGGYAVGTVGGSADAIVVAHGHTISDPGHSHTLNAGRVATRGGAEGGDRGSCGDTNISTDSATTGISINSAGVSGTNANLPPYYALCYIQKMF